MKILLTTVTSCDPFKERCNYVKRIIRLLCVILTLSILMAVPAMANESAVTPYANPYLNMYSTYLFRTSSTTFQVWFDVEGNGRQDVLGVSRIIVERYNSSDGDWDALHTYYAEDHPEMLCENTASHVGHIDCSGSSRHEFRALVTFYAENANGFGERNIYAYFI